MSRLFINLKIEELLAQIGEFETKIFLKKICKYGIPVPSRWDEKTQDKYWDNNFYGEYRQLSDAGYHELRKMLREEKKRFVKTELCGGFL